MVENHALAVLFALGSSLTIAWGTVVRHRIATAAGERRSDAIVDAVRVPMWWAGVFAALFGYVLQIIALSFGTLLVVQPILVLSLMFTLLLAAQLDGRRVSRSETVWASVLTVAVATLILLGKPTGSGMVPDMDVWLWCLGISAVASGVIYTIALGRPPTMRAMLLGAVTGTIMGFLAVLSKSVVNIFAASGVEAVVSSWEVYGLILAAVMGTAVQQASFNAGPLKSSLPAMTVVEPIVAFLLGYLVLHEKLQVQGSEWAYVGLAIAALVGATIVLSQMSVGE